MKCDKISENKKVIKLLKKRRKIEKKINKIDEKAIINYELYNLTLDSDE